MCVEMLFCVCNNNILEKTKASINSGGSLKPYIKYPSYGVLATDWRNCVYITGSECAKLSPGVLPMFMLSRVPMSAVCGISWK
jgi:hypothetical protein